MLIEVGHLILNYYCLISALTWALESLQVPPPPPSRGIAGAPSEHRQSARRPDYEVLRGHFSLYLFTPLLLILPC